MCIFRENYVKNNDTLNYFWAKENMLIVLFFVVILYHEIKADY